MSNPLTYAHKSDVHKCVTNALLDEPCFPLVEPLMTIAGRSRGNGHDNIFGRSMSTLDIAFVYVNKNPSARDSPSPYDVDVRIAIGKHESEEDDKPHISEDGVVECSYVKRVHTVREQTNRISRYDKAAAL